MNQNNCLKLAFVTTNRHKFEEARDILSEFGIEVEWKNIDLPEPDGDIDSVAKEKAKSAASRLNKTVAVDDTGVFFEAYNDFPGSRPKFIFNSIGYDGIMRLLKGKSRKAYFRTVVGYCEPGKKPIVFDGIMRGEITEKVFDEDRDVLPYMRIFIPEGHKKVISGFSMEEKNKISHRAKAFRKLGGYLSKKKI